MTAGFFIQGRRVIVNANRKVQHAAGMPRRSKLGALVC
jgi:hypothetical protein